MPKTSHHKPTVQEMFLTFKRRVKHMEGSCILLEATNMIRYANKQNQLAILEPLAIPLFQKIDLLLTCHCDEEDCPHWQEYEPDTEYDDNGNRLDDNDESGGSSCECGYAFDCKGLFLSIRPSYLSHYITTQVYPI